MTFTPFETPEAALAACESAGLQPLVGSDHQFGTKYGVCPPGFQQYINCYGDQDFLAWCNSFFKSQACPGPTRPEQVATSPKTS